MAILVTGGAGYIGSVVVEDLLEQGEKVIVLDNLSRGHRAAVPSEVAFYEGDIGDKNLISQIASENETDVCMHFSAWTAVGESVEKPDIYYKNNTFQTTALLDALIENNVKKFVFSSTAAVFGEPQRKPIDETHPQQPTNPYGWSKFFVEKILESYDAAFGLKFVALRYFNACGATEKRGEHHDPETHLIPLVLQAAQGKRESVSIFGNDYATPDGTAIRDYIHVSDLSQAHLLALEHLRNGKNSEFINLGNGQGFSVNAVIETARKITGKTIEAKSAPRRAGDPSRLIADAKKAREILGWKPQFPDLEPIIKSAWAWHLANPEGYK